MPSELKLLIQKVCPEHRDAFKKLSGVEGCKQCFNMNTAFGVHILECDTCEAAVQELINLDKKMLEYNLGRIESSSPYLPEPTLENTARTWQ